MSHLVGDGDVDTFASLVEALRRIDAIWALEPLRKEGVKSARHLEHLSRPELRRLLGHEASDRFFAPPKVARSKNRADLPDVHPYARGSLQRLGVVQHGPGQVAAVNWAQADERFMRDRFASTSHKPRESRWSTWTKLCRVRGIDPVPVTEETIFKIGAALKEGRYRSAAQYFSIAKSQHRELGFPWSADLDLAVSQAVRSVTRGMGPARLKHDFVLENAPADFGAQLHLAYDILKVPPEQRFASPEGVVVSACWFMLRGIELANVRCADVTFRRDERSVRIRLPVSKTDTEAKGCERSHSCFCRPRHAPGCASSQDAATMFTPLQKCQCQAGRQPLCVFHAMLSQSISLRRQGSWQPESPFFPSPDASVPSKRMVARLAQAAALVLMRAQFTDWPLESVVDWAQHSFRVAGAQFFARGGVQLGQIQLVGRWGSMSILRYVQDAMVQIPSASSDRIEQYLSGGLPGSFASSQLQNLVRDMVAQCVQGQGALVHNIRSKLAHKPALAESSVPSELWVSQCGKWKYGMSSSFRNATLLPGFSQCTVCFPESATLASAASAAREEGESGTDSSSS